MAETLVGAVGVFCQVAANRFADFSCLEVRHDLVVELFSGCVPFFGGLDPFTAVLPDAGCVVQDSGTIFGDRCAEVSCLWESKKGYKSFAV